MFAVNPIVAFAFAILIGSFSSGTISTLTFASIWILRFSRRAWVGTYRTLTLTLGVTDGQGRIGVWRTSLTRGIARDAFAVVIIPYGFVGVAVARSFVQSVTAYTFT